MTVSRAPRPQRFQSLCEVPANKRIHGWANASLTSHGYSSNANQRPNSREISRLGFLKEILSEVLEFLSCQSIMVDRVSPN